jgi:signal transduction histidine kinase
VRRIPIHTKLAAALAIPLLALVSLAVLEVVRTRNEAKEVRGQVAIVKAATGPDGLFNALQDERNRAASFLVGLGPEILQLPCEDNQACRAETDQALTRFQDQIESGSSAIREAYGTAFAELDALGETRQFVDDDPEPHDINSNLDDAEQVFITYSTMIDALLAAQNSLGLQVDDPELRRGMELSYQATRATDLIAHTVERLLNSIPKGGMDPTSSGASDRIAIAAAWFAQSERSYMTIKDIGTGDYEGIVEQLVEESEAMGFRQLAPQLINGSRSINITELLATVSPARDESFYGFRANIRELLTAKADALAQDSDRQSRIFQALAVAAIGLAILATWLVSRSITRPLRALTRQATEMANHRLPDAVLDILDTPLGDDVTVPAIEPIRVQTRDEVADVADALNTVQDSALDLAVEQAVLRRNIADSFVNLGRRNQNLLGRQLDFITELEHNETDPDTLANLFRLDHLATRMRRNAESLLVLAGIDPPRKWAAPVRITDAIRAALGEVEDYQRVTVRAVEPATILGSAAADLAHLLAELIENALIFSPPDQTVEIRGRAQPTGYTLAIIDSGLGMPPDELARANRRLAGAESFTIAPSKYLGHYVAGNLAARHNINVTLHNSPGHGITATINIPPTLLTIDATADGGTPQVIPPAEVQVITGPTDLAALAELGPAPTEPPAALPFAGTATGGPPSGLTASGLTKRTPRLPEAMPSNPGTQPNDDLLQTLAQYTSQRQDVPPVPPAPPGPGQGVGPGTGPGSLRPGNPLSPATGTPALSHLPPFPITPPSGYPIPVPPEPADGQPPADSPAPPQPPLPLRPPPALQPPALPRRHQPPAATHPPSRPAAAANGPGGLGGPARPGSLAGGLPGANLPEATSGQTAAGLTRRIRGAQLPRTHTVSIRRPPQQPSADRRSHLTPAGGVPLRGPGPELPGPTPEDSPPAGPTTGGFSTGPPAAGAAGGFSTQHSAKDVYSFLADFSAGVQRGLDETHIEGPAEDEGPDGNP